MIVAEFSRKGQSGGLRGGNGVIRKLKVRGHAEYAAHGEDIVCAAASVTVYTAAGALNMLCGVPDNRVKEKDGFFELTVPVFTDSDTAYRANIIMETAYIGFKQIEASYPDCLKVTENVKKTTLESK